MAQSPASSASRQWARKALPIIGSALILYYYFHGQDWRALWDAAGRADLWLAALAVAVPQLVFWFFETLLTQRHLEWFHGPFSFREYFWTRGAIYILQLINTPLGGGGALLYIKRKARIGWRKLIGIMLFRFGLTLWGLDLFLIPATLLLYHYGLAARVKINLWAWWALLIGGLLWLCEAWIFWHRGRHIGLSRFVVRDRMSEFWSAFQQSPPRRWLLTWAMTMPPLMLMLVGLYFLSLAFGVRPPFWEFMAVAPLLFLIIDLPIALAGFGTTTMAWKLFFPDYGSPDDVMALTLFFPFVRGLTRALIGLVSLRPAMRDIGRLFQENDAGKE
ncbi:MAG TPA: lysylphosphatidylglycerol synthase transmembrane domain-containing protein [bacterium]|nr:lysylphosphatidylglycerol synthase transmembrane domain-containing protein [bacterium]